MRLESAQHRFVKFLLLCHRERLGFVERLLDSLAPVSYTHLDVYKRQGTRRLSQVLAEACPGHHCVALSLSLIHI